MYSYLRRIDRQKEVLLLVNVSLQLINLGGLFIAVMDRSWNPSSPEVVVYSGFYFPKYIFNTKKRWLVRLFILFLVIYSLSWTYPNRSFFTPRDKKINKLIYDYTISPKVCSRGKSPALLVLVLSTVEGIAQRKGIRETWGSVARNPSWPSRQLPASVKFVYLFGLSRAPDLNKQLTREADEFGDILQVGLIESYGLNVTQKILMGFKWAREHCLQTRHVLKVDDDVFVDLPLLMQRLKSPEWGSYICGHAVILAMTKRSGKYYLSFSEYPYLFIPSYIFGYYYVLPMQILSELVEASQYVPYLRMEDVYITAVLPRVIRTSYKAFKTFFTDRNFKFHICDFFSGTRDASVDVSADQMYAIWKTYIDENSCSSDYTQ